MNTATSAATEQSPAKRSYPYKRICVLKPGVLPDTLTGKKRFTTVSMSPSDWDRAVRFAYGDERRVTDTVRAITSTVNPEDLLPGDISLIVRRKTLARLKSQFQPKKAAAAAARADANSEAAALAAENNGAWATA
jgi:hypothetical protein